MYIITLNFEHIYLIIHCNLTYFVGAVWVFVVTGQMNIKIPFLLLKGMWIKNWQAFQQVVFVKALWPMTKNITGQLGTSV